MAARVGVQGVTCLEAPERQGLYDPRNEHDACGVGFVANIKGRKSHEVIACGLRDPGQPRPPRRGGRRSAGRRRRRLPDPDSRRAAAATGPTGRGRRPAAGRANTRVAMCFLPQDEEARELAHRPVRALPHASRGQPLIGWRDVPVDTTGLGEAVLAQMPVIRQAIIGRGAERRATRTPSSASCWRSASRPRTRWRELAAKNNLPGLTELYMPSFSTRTVVYKGLLLARQVGTFYKDLTNPLTESALALVHQRFSTNTFPSWKLAHPYRFIAHNGEINTVRGNVNWMNARRRTLEIGAAGARPRQDVAADPARPVGHRLPRQRARAAGGRRLSAGPRGDDADPGGLGRQSADGSPSAGPSTSTTPP